MKSRILSAVFSLLFFLMLSGWVSAQVGEPYIHDPSTITECDGKYYTLGTGAGGLISEDGWTWRKGAVRPGGGVAPDIIKINDRYYVTYAKGGGGLSGGHASNVYVMWTKTLDPNSPDFKFNDETIVASSDGIEDCDAIDSAFLLDPNDGRLWLTYGTYFGFIRIVELDPKTGKRIPGNEPVNIAIDCEATAMMYRDGWYYLLGTHGTCCDGANSTYNIRVGRSKSITGPYVDHMGVPMLKGGGKLVVAASGHYVGPGHFGLIDLGDGVQKFSCHYEADLVQGGHSVLGIRPLLWKDRWPVASDNFRKGTYEIQSERSGYALELAVDFVRMAGGMRFFGRNIEEPVVPVPPQKLTEVEKGWPKDNIDVRIGDYMGRPHQKWAITPVPDAGGYFGSPYFKITIEGTGRSLAATAGKEVITVPEFTGAPEQLWQIDQLTDGTYRIMPKAVPGSDEKLTLTAVGRSTPTLAGFELTAIIHAGLLICHKKVHFRDNILGEIKTEGNPMFLKEIINRKASYQFITGYVLTSLLLFIVFSGGRTFGADKKIDTSSCSAFTKLETSSFLVEKAEIVPEGPAPGPGGKEDLLPEHCLIQGMLNPRTGVKGQKFGIGFELRMPTNWNKRFFFQGGGGLDGVLSPAIGNHMGAIKPSALSRGFAVVSTDGGHRSSMLDGTFGLDQQARIDYGYNALDKVTLKAKELIEKYYGSAPSYSYFIGCSNGGRQALMASQRFPLYFDGIVAGDPAIKFSGIAMDEIWNLQVAARIAPKDENGRPIISKAFSDNDLRLVADTLLDQCDALDGLSDGFINDWQGCDFDPGILTCKSEKTETCLSKAQADALNDMFKGPHTKDGKSIYGPFNYDTGIAESAWRGMHIGSSGTGKWDSADATLGLVNLSYLQLTPPDPDLNPLDFDFDRDAVRTRHTAANTDADSTFLSTFAGHGKMIVYNGLSDQGMASGVLSDWYDEVVKVNGESIRDSVRLFFIPGMCHCAGGKSTDSFNMFDAITDWVEKGKAPERIIATGKAFPGVSRPLCPYPLVARYRSGDINSADSFVCSE